MKSELIVDVQPSAVSIALLEDGRLMSLQKEARNIAYAVGDIYLAKVKKIMPGLNAAFVNVGYEKDAFLHYLDLGAQFASYRAFLDRLFDGDRKHVPSLSKMKMLPDIDKHGTITDRLTSGQELLVQIVKEPISTKGPRLTTEITFTGRYLVLIPFSDKVSVSQKIKTTEEKVRLRQLINSIKPKNFGVIVRTSAEGKRVAELNSELKTLVKCWEDACARAQRQTAPSLVFEEESRIVGMLRDVFSPSFEAIHVNDRDTFDSILNYVSLIAPERKDIVHLYEKPEPIFDTFSVTRQIKSSFGKTVSFKSGAYIIIEHTEALHVIDVNSGNRTKATNDQEANALEVNLRAADEIARQLRLRDMGGIIVIDYIDMNKNEHRQALYDHMREVMANDRARHNILPLSKFGLMQITRQRVRPALDIAVNETCPSCFGKGEIQPSLLFTDRLYEKLEYVINELELRNFRLYVHPFVEAYLKKGWLLSEFSRWKRRLGARFRLYSDQSLAYLQYRVVDEKGNEVDVKQEKDLNSATLEKSSTKSSVRGLTEDVIDAAEAFANEPREPKAKKPKAKKQEAPLPAEPRPAKEEKESEPRQQKPKAQKPQKAVEPVEESAETTAEETAAPQQSEKTATRRSRSRSRKKDVSADVPEADEKLAAVVAAVAAAVAEDAEDEGTPSDATDDSAGDDASVKRRPRARGRRGRGKSRKAAEGENSLLPVPVDYPADTEGTPEPTARPSQPTQQIEVRTEEN